MKDFEPLSILIKKKYPLTSKYDFNWTRENSLGSNVVVLAESLSRGIAWKYAAMIYRLVNFGKAEFKVNIENVRNCSFFYFLSGRIKLKIYKWSLLWTTTNF